MKILMLSNDVRIAKSNSPTTARMVDLGGLTESLDIVIFGYSGPRIFLSGKVTVWPSAKNKIAAFLKTVFFARRLVTNSGNWLITTQDPFLAGLAGLVIKSKFPKISLQFQLHTDLLSPYFRRQSFLNYLRYRLAVMILTRANCLRVVSRRLKDSLLRQFPNLKIEILPVFVEAEKIRNSDLTVNLHEKYPNFKTIVLMASRLSKEKNFPLALEAFKRVVKKEPQTLLLIVGDGPERKNLEFGIKNLGLGKNVVLEPWTDDLFSYYKTADIYLLTSDFEGYSRTVIEAMIAGCPVVMTDVGIAGDVAKSGSNSLVAPVGDKEKLQQAMLEILGNDELRTRLKNGALATAATLPSSREYLDDYKKMLTACR